MNKLKLHQKHLSTWQIIFPYVNMIFAPWRYLNYMNAVEAGQTPAHAYKHKIQIFK